MPDLLFKLCPKCHRMMPVGNGARLCASCAEADSKNRVRKRNYKREYAIRDDDPRLKSFYRSKAWQLASKKYAHSVGYRCERCGDIGTDVHHKEPIRTEGGWERRFDWSNLELLCVRCHNEEHGRTFKNGWKDGYGRAEEETARPADEASHEGGEGGEDGRGGVLRVSDYRV